MTDKPRRKVVDAYQLANRILPDDENLANLNAVLEINEGLLATSDLDGHAASREESATLAAWISITCGEQDSFHLLGYLSSTLEKGAMRQKLLDAVRNLPARMPAQDDFTNEASFDPPWTLAAVALWELPGGTSWPVFYHHPALMPEPAAAVLQRVAQELEETETSTGEGADAEGSDDPPPSGSGPN